MGENKEKKADNFGDEEGKNNQLILEWFYAWFDYIEIKKGKSVSAIIKDCIKEKSDQSEKE